MKIIWTGLLLSLLCTFMFVSPHATYAAVMRSGDTIRITDDIDDTVLVVGQDVRIDAKITGDVYCAGQSVYIEGEVSGDVICAAQNLIINAQVDGDIRAASQSLVVGGDVTRNVLALGQTVSVNGLIGRDLLFAGQSVNVDGIVGRNLTGGGETINLGGVVKKDSYLYVTKLYLGPGVQVAGNLTYESENEASTATGATISGTLVRREPTFDTEGRKFNYAQRQKTASEKLADKVKSLVFMLIISLLFVHFFKHLFAKTAEIMLKDSKRSMLRGFLLLVFTPILIVFLAITLIGIPFALVLAIVYGFTVAVSHVFAAYATGVKLGTDYLRTEKAANAIYVNTIAGVLLLWLLNLTPVVGWFTSFFVAIWGMGGIYLYFRSPKVLDAKK